MALSLYIHYPFCQRKCLYCDFLSGPGSREQQQRYLTALETEIALSGMEGAVVDTIFFGGGTPSLMEACDLERILSAVREHFRVQKDAEISLECNPGTVDFSKLKGFRHAGINRLSVGIQSFHDDELQLLGRIHTREQALACCHMARDAGFDNLSIDLMCGLPGQTWEAWMDNLEMAVALEPEHISAYGLILEEGTPLEREYRQGELAPVAEDEEDRRMYHDTRAFLGRYGYHRYEISNYAKDGRECRHNLGYWSGHEYLGLGLGSSSLIGNYRFHNIRELERYESLCEKGGSLCKEDGRKKPAAAADPVGREAAPAMQTPVTGSLADTDRIPFRSRRIPGLLQEVEQLSFRDRMGEFMWLGLRKTEGVSEEEFGHSFGLALMSVFGDIIEGHIRRGLLVREDGWIRLTEYGTDISNFVMADFV